jgi:hypothetical protein
VEHLSAVWVSGMPFRSALFLALAKRHIYVVLRTVENLGREESHEYKGLGKGF